MITTLGIDSKISLYLSYRELKTDETDALAYLLDALKADILDHGSRYESIVYTILS